MKEQIKTLMLIGNGFDVACGYATKYSEFVESQVFKELLGNGSKLCKHIDNVKSIQNWVDLETELYNYSKINTKECGINNREFADNFKSEYMNLSEALQNYIISINGKKDRDIPKDENMKQIVKLWCAHNDIMSAVCFNYSQFFHLEIVYNYFINSDKLKKVHGSINIQIQENDTKIVLGIDDSMVVDPLHSFLYKSHNENLQIEGIGELIMSAEKYIVFGCSIGCTDEWYFKKVFSRKGKSFEVYYYGEKEKYEILNRIHVLSGGMQDFRSNNNLKWYDSSSLYELSKKLESDYKMQ